MSQINKTPIRCFDGDAKPYEPFWNFRSAADPGESVTLELYGAISEFSWMGDEVSPAKFSFNVCALHFALHLQHDAANHLVRWRLILIMASMRVRKQSTGWSAKSPAK